MSAYVVALAGATRSAPELRLGMSTRASLALVRAAQAYAAGDGRAYVVPDDVKALAPAVVGHRLLLSPEAEVRGASVAEVLSGVLSRLAAPALGGRR